MPRSSPVLKRQERIAHARSAGCGALHELMEMHTRMICVARSLYAHAHAHRTSPVARRRGSCPSCAKWLTNSGWWAPKPARAPAIPHREPSLWASTTSSWVPLVCIYAVVALSALKGMLLLRSVVLHDIMLQHDQIIDVSASDS